MKDSTTAHAIAYFGYGSLVNLGSLRTPYISAHRATVRGWNRTWLARPQDAQSFASLDGLAFLSVVPAPGNEIDGLLITDHASSLPDLDQRESLYSRVTLKDTELTLHDDQSIDVAGKFLYEADDYHTAAVARIPRSYLDVVMQGYLQHFGTDGLQRFFATTQNFDLEIYEDRENPVYPRATTLTEEEISIFKQFRDFD